jgi:hypothetical protein
MNPHFQQMMKGDTDGFGSGGHDNPSSYPSGMNGYQNQRNPL